MRVTLISKSVYPVEFILSKIWAWRVLYEISGVLLLSESSGRRRVVIFVEGAKCRSEGSLVYCDILE